MKKKLFLTAIAVMVLVLTIVYGTVQASKDAPVVETHIVQPGETLWGIATVNRGTTEIRKYIYQIQSLNDVGSTIYPGQTLILP